MSQPDSVAAALEHAQARLCIPERDEDGPAGDRLLPDYFGMYRVEWPDDPGVEFHLGHGGWIGLLRRCGFEVEGLLEIRPPQGSTTRYPFVTLEWSRRWPCEEVWRARKRA
ncbi:MAG TPA: hypothetical protein VKF59_08860 [Candidatus Dormibacteraeota bacterium]|nr:hypothetical protein [Candidatus Dormibacteraeota bacterium]